MFAATDSKIVLYFVLIWSNLAVIYGIIELVLNHIIASRRKDISPNFTLIEYLDYK